MHSRSVGPIPTKPSNAGHCVATVCECCIVADIFSNDDNDAEQFFLYKLTARMCGAS